MDEDFEIKVIPSENFPPGMSGASAFLGKIHYIFINVNLSQELQEKALKEETARTIVG